MTVLVFDPSGSSAPQLSDLLKQAHREARATSDEVEARRLAQLLGVVVIALTDQVSKSIDLIRHVRETESGSVYLLVAAPANAEAQVELAYEAGCDCDVRLPTTASAFNARLLPADRRQLSRVSQTARSAVRANGARPLTPATPGAATTAAMPAARPAPSSILEVVVRSAAWRGMGADLQRVASTFLTVNCNAVRLEGEPDIALARGIVLANVDQQLEVRVALATDAKSARTFTTHLFGEDSSDLEADMLGELANMAMGALKAAFAKESVPFTGGLPEALPPNRFLQFNAQCVHVEQFALAVHDARIFVRVGIHSKRNVLVGAPALQEGMVLAKDVFNAKGMLLLTAGTRLSATSADRLRQALARTQSVEVAWRGQ
ncbi:MAG: hypothetical protein U0271_48160 [Polyangiaceae bacterium]